MTPYNSYPAAVTKIPTKHVMENRNGIHISWDHMAEFLCLENLEKSGALMTIVEKLAMQPMIDLRKTHENAEPCG